MPRFSVYRQGSADPTPILVDAVDDPDAATALYASARGWFPTAVISLQEDDEPAAAASSAPKAKRAKAAPKKKPAARRK